MQQDGYVVDVAYPDFFYRDMQPLWLSTVLRFQGVVGPDVCQPFRYCELGCGQGLNLLVAAALNPQAHFVGVDLNPGHVERLQSAARQIGLANVEVHCTSFERYAGQVPQASFDFVVSHGTWSWLAPEAQCAVLDVVQHGLAPQGVGYVHYMCHPGSTPMIPIQKLFQRPAGEAGQRSMHAVSEGLRRVAALSASGLFDRQPELLARVRKLQQTAPEELAHDFLARHWSVDHSVDMHARLARRGLRFVGSAEVFDNLDPTLSVPQELQALLAAETSPAMRETLKDLARAQRQRSDLTQRDPQLLNEVQYREQCLQTGFALLEPQRPLDASCTFETPIGLLQAPHEMIQPLWQRLATAAVPSLEQLLMLPAVDGRLGWLLQTLQLLMHAGVVHPSRGTQAPRDEAAERAMARWLAQQGWRLALKPECATALRAA